MWFDGWNRLVKSDLQLDETDLIYIPYFKFIPTTIVLFKIRRIYRNYAKINWVITDEFQSQEITPMFVLVELIK